MAAERIRMRINELLSSETKVCESLNQLMQKLQEIEQDKAWKLGPEHVKLITRTSGCCELLIQLHETIAEKVAMFVGPSHLAGVFEASENELITHHSEFQTLSSCVMVVLQKKAGGQVIGDRAVGTSPKLFLDEMVKDAAGSPDEENVRKCLNIAKRLTSEINERIRGIQRRERVVLIASRVRAVPPEIEIVKEGREFLLDDGYFREHGRAGYRHLYLFNDAVLVCKPGETVIGKFFTKNDRDLKFKRFIPLAAIKPSELPVVRDPAVSEEDSPGGLSQLPFFELRDKAGKCAFHHQDREKLQEWVTAIRNAIDEITVRGSQNPVPAYRLPNSSEDIRQLSQDLSGYVVLGDKDGESEVFVF
ncbi:hypothetical protein GUITHDRAFT_101546 [Guillardia theta CCMP2712]|uniref:PH domain-containing protein n=1 Tax=Guillardia theta (strain CCMP2712) TaxID=905079 RepID=L1JY13_GUITC|nr:hypothetical protein GUITHDRAFT_101546 [Guillardia theta CCMP2712]EKX53105.1 hypothetical protein GUITHDRAFT_101546 [Guillardia theta CCMP2712]|eukprot:XP_005840085.1 hypothetical protein GUITHDRAFT_101546 [Guillardia theta CCMP2712]